MKTIENAHITADTKYSVSHVGKIAVMSKEPATEFEIDQSSEKETDSHLREQDGLRPYKLEARRVR